MRPPAIDVVLLGTQGGDGRDEEDRCKNSFHQYLTRRRAASSTSFSDGRKNSSNGGEYGTGVSSAPMTRTGASSHSNASSWMTAARLSPIPPVFESSCTIITR